jgi:hypothetical protein
MVEYTRPATWEDLKNLARYLEEAKVDYALIGGYAIAAHGYNRFSEDVDILVDPSPANTRRWIAALQNLPDRATAELVGQDDIFEREGRYAIRVNDEFTVDVMPSVCGHSWDELKAYIVTMQIDGEIIRVLSLEGLLLTKEGMRDRDRADAQVLRAAIERIKKK